MDSVSHLGSMFPSHPLMAHSMNLGSKFNVHFSETTKDGIVIMTLTAEIGAPVEPDALIPMFPSYRLKVIPRADGPGAAIKQIVEASPQDVTTHLLYGGTGIHDYLEPPQNQRM